MKQLLTSLVFLLVASAATPALANRVSFGDDVVVGADEAVEGSLVVIGADARVDGSVSGDVVVVGGELTVGPAARVQGDAVAVGGAFERSAGSIVGGTPNAGSPSAVEFSTRALPSGSAGRFVRWAVFLALELAVGLLFLGTWPERSRNVRRTIEAAPATALLLGGLVSLGLALLVVLLTITVVGILALPLVTVVTGVAWLAGLAGLFEALGDRLPLPSARRTRASSFVAGCLTFEGVVLVGLIVPSLSWVAPVLFTLAAALAVGAAVLSGLGRAPYGA